ncbi:MAG: hypothetical protein M5R36_07700 [Deltaproteobacteria bacterium]|nr:hypothetical protein [Deltaproteobacteria bacterium]
MVRKDARRARTFFIVHGHGRGVEHKPHGPVPHYDLPPTIY